MRRSARALAALLALIISLLVAATTASGAVVINEVESNDAVSGDFVELTNTDLAPVDISGYVIKDSSDGNSFTVPDGTVIQPHAYYVAHITLFGLGAGDSARLFAPADPSVPVDSYTWTSHATTTYGRCPDGTGPLIVTEGPTPGAANACPGAEPPPDADSDGVPDASDACPTVPASTVNGCPPGTTPPPPGPGGDTTPPLAALSGKRKQKLGRRVTVTVVCDEACAASPTGTLRLPGASRPFKLRGASKSIPAGGKATLSLRISKRARKIIRATLKRGRRVRAKVTVVAMDTSGNATTNTRTIRLTLG